MKNGLPHLPDNYFIYLDWKERKIHQDPSVSCDIQDMLLKILWCVYRVLSVYKHGNKINSEMIYYFYTQNCPFNDIKMIFLHWNLVITKLTLLRTDSTVKMPHTFLFFISIRKPDGSTGIYWYMNYIQQEPFTGPI